MIDKLLYDMTDKIISVISFLVKNNKYSLNINKKIFYLDDNTKETRTAVINSLFFDESNNFSLMVNYTIYDLKGQDKPYFKSVELNSLSVDKLLQIVKLLK